MALDPSIFFAALGITMLEIVEAAAVGLALYGDSKSRAAFLYVSLGIIVVFAPLFVIGNLFSKLPFYDVKLVGGVLMVYFGQRLIKSARKAVLKARKGQVVTDQPHKDIMATGFSVGAIEAFEASIVLVSLFPVDYNSTLLGMGLGIVVVVVATFILRNQVRKIKQANMKVVISALLVAFGALWFTEVGLHYAGLLRVSLSHKLLHPNPNFFNIITAPTTEQNLLILPYFLIALFLVYKYANRRSPPEAVPATSPAAQPPKR